MKIEGATGLGGLWALEWAWHIRVTKLWFVGVRVGVAYSRNKLALKATESKSEIPILYLWLL